MYRKHISTGLLNIGKISFGTMIGQLISIISVPILTRIYGANVIGYWALFTSISVIINSFSDLGLSNAIMFMSDDKSAQILYGVISIINIVISTIVALMILIFYFLFPDSGGYSPIFITIIIFILIITSQQTQLCYTWLNRKKDYSTLMKNPILNQSAIFLISVILGLLEIKQFGYFIGMICGQIITLIHMKRKLPVISYNFNLSIIKRMLYNNRNFIIYQLPTNVLTNIKNQLPVFLTKTFFGSEVLGYYSISQKVLNIPIQLIANAIGKVFFSTTSDMVRHGKKIGEFVYGNLKKASYIAIIPMIILISIGDYLILIFFGNEYIIAATMFRIVSFQALFTFLMMSTQGIHITISKQKYALRSVIAQMCVYFIGYWIGGVLLGDIYITLILVTILYSVIQIVYFSYIFKAMGISEFRYIINIIIVISIILISSYLLRYLLLYYLNI